MVKTSNIEPHGTHAAAATRGSRSTNVAGSKGMIWRDAVSESSGQIRDMTVRGLTFYDNDDGTGLLEAAAGNAIQTIMTPAQLTANTDNWDPVDAVDSSITLANATIIRASTNASRNLTGLVAAGSRHEFVLTNVGSNDLVLKHDVTSTAANRFYCPDNSDYTVQRNMSVVLVYDEASARWRVVSGAAVSGGLGAWTSYTPTLTAVTTNPTIGNGTLVGRYKMLDSKTMAINISWAFGSTSNAGNGNYTFAIPPGYVVGRASSLAGYLLDVSTSIYVVSGYLTAGATTVGNVVVADSVAPRWLSHTNPMAWATGDVLALTGIIEIA